MIEASIRPLTVASDSTQSAPARYIFRTFSVASARATNSVEGVRSRPTRIANSVSVSFGSARMAVRASSTPARARASGLDPGAVRLCHVPT
jgi:hypothetical protein